MTIHFEEASGRRKELVQALTEVTGCKSEYLGAPTFDYKVGDYIIHRDGSVEADDLLDVKELGLTFHSLRAHGFIQEGSEWDTPEKAPTEEETQACLTAPREDGVALSFPKDGMSEEAISNVKKIIAAKAPLIKLALELDELPIEDEEDKLTFTWLPITAPHEMIDATTRLLAAIMKLAKKLRRVTATERQTDNPRYAFRCFLLRLGFIGDEYKTVRKYLMKGIPGNGSKRHPAIESDAGDIPSADDPVEVESLEKLDPAIIAEDNAANTNSEATVVE